MKKMMLTIVGCMTLLGADSYGQGGENVDHEALHQAFRACAEQLGLPAPEPGQRPQRPSQEQRTAMDACLKEKGFDKPPRPPHHGRGRYRMEQQSEEE